MPIALLPDRAVLDLAGADRVAFLQGLVSGDVAQATADRAVWAALLTPQGKWLADFFVIAEGERLLLDVEAGQAAMLLTRLARFRLRSRVTLAETTLRVRAGWNEVPPVAGFADPRLAAAGWRWFGDAGPTDATAEDWDAHRLALGLPDGSRDLEAEKTVLLEAGFDELGGVSWTKGCFMGQELTARTRYRGLVKRRLMPVEVAGPLPPRGTPVLDAAGTEVGDMRSGRAARGLALLRLEAAGAPTLRCGNAVLTPRIPPWMRLPARDAA